MIPEPFWLRVDQTEGCWYWTGSIDRYGYGSLMSGGRKVAAHRYSYEAFVGPIPPGLDIDHVCHGEDKSCTVARECLHRRCVNPAHLEPVTRSENLRRGHGVGKAKKLATHCLRGHPFDEENTSLVNGGKARLCRTCARQRWRDAYYRKKAS